MKSYLSCIFFRAILKNNWSEVVDLILKPRPGGKGPGADFPLSVMQK